MPVRKNILPRESAPKVAAGALFLSNDGPLARVLLIVGSLIPVMLFEALVLRSMWLWFVTPLWPRPISYPEALGLILLSFLLRANRWSLPDNQRRDLWIQLKQIIAHLLGRALIWAFAVVCHAVLF